MGKTVLKTDQFLYKKFDKYPSPISDYLITVY